VSDGILDTNVFLHAHATDNHSAECRRLLTAVANGQTTAIVDPLVAHELSYALPRLRKQMTRADVAGYLLQVLSWSGVRGDVDLLSDAVRIWRDSPGVAFVDTYLMARGLRENRPIFTKNLRDFANRGVTVPDPLIDPL
jgi:predicted nucleic acid-binding protein